MVTGYPDFGRTVQTNALPLIVVNAVVGGSDVLPPEYIGDLGYVDVFADTANLNDHYSIGLRWWDNPNETTYAGQDNFVTGPGMETGIQYKARGRYLSAIVANNEATDVNPVQVYFRGTNAQARVNAGNQQSAPIAWSDSTPAAGGSTTTLATTVVPGPATFAVQHNSNASWDAELQFWNTATKSWQRFVHYNGAVIGQSLIAPVTLPAAPVRMVVTNGDTVARTIFASLTA